MLKTGCLIIVIAIMIFLTFIAIKQGYNTIFYDNWNDNYIEQKAVVTSIFKDSSYLTSNGTGSWNYGFEPIVAYTFKNNVKIDTLVWHRSIEKSNFFPGDSLDVIISNIDGKLSKSVDQDRVATGIVNLVQGAFFLMIAVFAFRYLKKKQNSKVREL